MEQRERRQGPLRRLTENQAEVVNQVMIQVFVIMYFLFLLLCLFLVNLSFCQFSFDVSLPLHYLDESVLVLCEATRQSMVDVNLLEGYVVSQQVIHHVKLQVLLQALESVLVLRLFVDNAAHKVVVCLVEVTEVGDLKA